MDGVLLATLSGTSGFPILLGIVDIGLLAGLLLSPVIYPPLPILLYDLDSEVWSRGSTIGVLLKVL